MSNFSGHFGLTPVVLSYGNIITWDSDTSFDNGTLDATVEISGVGNIAVLRLKDEADNSDDVPFTNTANYSYTSSEITIAGGEAKLTIKGGNFDDWPFTTSGNYTFTSANIEVNGGVAKLQKVASTPYAWYHLNATAGATASDSSGNGRDGTLVNMEDVDWVAGHLNNCLVFDGTNEYVDCGDIADFGINDAFSLECWIKTTTTSDAIMARWSGGKGYQMYIAGGGTLYVTLRSTVTTDECSRYSSGTINGGSWTHIAITYDGSGAQSGLNIYLNGSLNNGAGNDTLTSDFSQPTNFRLGARADGLYLNGELDEVVVYDSELAASQVSDRYNSGSGTETIEAYDITNPTIYNTASFAFIAPLASFTETSTTSATTAIKYNLSEDSGVTWKVWNGAAWTTSSGTYASANLASTCNTNIASLGSSGNFKFLAFLHSDTGADTPQLDKVETTEDLVYTTGNYVVSMDTDIDPVANYGWGNVTETITKPANTSISYQYSTDSGSSYNGTWLSAASMQTALIAIGSPNKVRVKFQLGTTDINATPEIDNLNIVSDAGFETYGEYESNKYASIYSGIGWKDVEFTTTTPAGTSIDIYARAGDTTAEIGVASYSIMNNEAIAGITGKYIQWKAELNGTPTSRPELDKISFKYSTPSYVIIEG